MSPRIRHCHQHPMSHPGYPKLGKGLVYRNVKCFFFVLLLLLTGSGFVRASDIVESRDSKGGGQWIHFYKTVVSATDGDRCGMSPSCSSYAAQAIKKHGFLVGWIISCDRLIRCGRDETRLSPCIQSGNKTLTKDTLEDNDFWWYPGK